ncbi:MAG: sensor domain-containing diguanylate cyclase [Pseudomonadota bacterium]
MPIGFLNDLNRSISRAEVFEAYAQWSGRIMKADRTTIALATEAGDALELMAIDGNSVIATGSMIPIEGSLIGRVFQTQTAEICDSLATSSYYEAPKLHEGGLVAVMDVPLSASGRHFGVLAQAFAGPPLPGEADLAVLQAIGNCLGSQLLLHEKLIELGELALTDPLTRLFNRRVYEDSLNKAWAMFTRNRQPFAVAIVDLDHFKAINDSYGHDFGDEVLKTVADTLTAMSRTTDTVVRMGGEEFGIILENTDSDQAKAIAERLCEDVRRLAFDHRGETVHVTASIGLALADASYDSPRLVGLLADRALYSAKQTGRNRVQIADVGSTASPDSIPVY